MREEKTKSFGESGLDNKINFCRRTNKMTPGKIKTTTKMNFEKKKNKNKFWERGKKEQYWSSREKGRQTEMNFLRRNG